MTSETQCTTKTSDSSQIASKPDERKSDETRLPRLDITDENVCNVQLDSADQLSELLGGASPEFCLATITHCTAISGFSEPLKDDKNHAIAIIAEIKPRDGIEAMLATQMAAIHLAAMRHSRLLAASDTLQRVEVHEKTFNKLNRTFVAQVEALRKLRTGGQQKMTVEHVTVNEGGQAIVGNVTKGGDQK